MKEHRDQYARVATVFEAADPIDPETGAGIFDGYLLGGFGDVSSLKAAIAGIRKVSDRPVFASVVVDGEGFVGGRTKYTLEDALAAMADFGADVAGFATFAGQEQTLALVARAKEVTDLPLLVSLAVHKRDPKQGEATAENPYYTPDAVADVALALRRAGVQFFRATGNATPAYTAVLAATLTGLDVVGK